uniref:Uncharacterized protein n=1 Tax=Orbilia oligospora TaxID=2813651 RepID=A0A6G6A4H6_ORBOL|nr:hypothetical protein [Orbilia oligospora]
MKAFEYNESDNLSSSSSDNLLSSSNNLPLSNNQEYSLNEDTSWAPFHNCSDVIFFEVINSNDLNSEYTNELNNDLNNTQKIIGRHWYWLFKKNINSENEEIEKKIEYNIYESHYTRKFSYNEVPQSVSTISDSGFGSEGFAEEMIQLGGGNTYEELQGYNNFHPLSNEIEARNYLKKVKNQLSSHEE